MPGKNLFPNTALLMAVIADESTVTGFLLTGMGQRSKEGQANYMIVNKETSQQDLEKFFTQLLSRNNIGIVFIAQNIAEMLRHIIVDHQEDEEKVLPTILEIPSKDSPYDPGKDSMLVKAACTLKGGEAGMALLQQQKDGN